MPNHKSYFFCGIGGSGMMPLAILYKKCGYNISGSDRSYDQGKTPSKFKALKDAGIKIFPQDGSGICSDIDALIVSSAVEVNIPDVESALEQNIPIVKRGKLLAESFNLAKNKIAVAGTSGKSSVTGMVGTILVEMDEDPTIVNGGEILNFRTNESDNFSGIRKGRDDLFVAEMDESDSSIAYYNPSIAILNNIALDHKSMDELEHLFGDFLERASKVVIVNYDQPCVKDLCGKRAKTKIISYAIDDCTADLVATNIIPSVHGISFTLEACGQKHRVELKVPGRHNVENALSALAVCYAMGLDVGKGVQAIRAFKGIHRRMECVGTSGGITIIDDFAHNPDKIAASLQTLKSFDGRLIVVFQPHGFGPLRLMGSEMVDVFKKYLNEDDYLLMPEAFYAGGTVDRSVTAKHLIENLSAKGMSAHWFSKRNEIPAFISDIASSGDRIVVMGARDDTLHIFAQEILKLCAESAS